MSGDYSGPEEAGVVLREPTIDHAVLEVARSGIIRRGLGFDNCNVGILLNVEEDHIGTDGVEDIEDLALVKSTVIEVVGASGISVLNADDPTIVGLKERAGGQLIYFSLYPENETVAQHLASDGTAVVLEGSDVVIRSPEPPVHVLSVLEAPITLRGVATFNTANVLAAVAALHGLGTPVNMIRSGISTFHPSATQNPGRMNLIDFVTFKVIIDYGHNVPAVRALGTALVVAQQSAKEASTADAADLWLGLEFLRWPRCCSRNCQIPEPLVWAMFVEEADIRFSDVVEMAQAEAQEVVQCFAFEGAYPSLNEGIRIWSKERCSQTADAVTLEEATERSRELGVAVVDEEPRRELLVIEPHHHIPPLLPDPLIVRVIRWRT